MIGGNRKLDACAPCPIVAYFLGELPSGESCAFRIIDAAFVGFLGIVQHVPIRECCPKFRLGWIVCQFLALLFENGNAFAKKLILP